MPKIVKSCLNLSKLRPKYYRFLFFWDTIDIRDVNESGSRQVSKFFLALEN